MANQSYLVATNYWTPLNNEDEDEPEGKEEEINAIKTEVIVSTGSFT